MSPDPYVAHRDLLFTVAYEMLGSAADAEDVVQETWLRWRDVDQAGVENPRAYLVRITTRLALNQMRTAARRRETYVGPWLPEPLITTGDVADDVELADSVSLAMLVVLDSLGPAQRAVFVLHEVFGFAHTEIALALDRTPEAVRQLAHRARAHVHERRAGGGDVDEHARVVEQFVEAAAGGDLQPLMDLMAPDVVLLTDGGGRVKAALRPIRGVDKVLRFLTAVRSDEARISMVSGVNGGAALVVHVAGRLDAVATVRVQGGLVTELHVVRNPDKVAGVASGVAVRLTR